MEAIPRQINKFVIEAAPEAGCFRGLFFDPFLSRKKDVCLRPYAASFSTPSSTAASTPRMAAKPSAET